MQMQGRAQLARIGCARGYAQRGVVAVVVALTIVAMLGMVGLAIDLGQLFVAKTEVQNAADACALSASQELHRDLPKAMERAEAAGRMVATLHRVGFQRNVIGSVSSPVTVTFSQTAAGPFSSGSGITGPAAEAMLYARCEVVNSGIKTFFIQVLNVLPGVTIGTQSVSASAVASRRPSQTSCAVPVALCADKVSTTAVGGWLEAVLSPQANGKDAQLSGNFRWVDLTPGAGGAADIAGQIVGEGVCNLPAIGAEIGKPGVMSSLGAAFNSRFGIYFGGVKAGDGAPDLSGYAYTGLTWADGANAFPNFLGRRSSNEPYQGVNIAGVDVSGTIQPSSYLQLNGRERRAVPVPVVNCSAFDSANKAPITQWACVFLLHPMPNNAGSPKDPKADIAAAKCGDSTSSQTKMCLEYRGPANASTSPCAASGMPGDPSSTGSLVPTLVR